MQNSKPGKLLVFILQDVVMMGSDEQVGDTLCESEPEIALRHHADMIPVEAEKEARLRSRCSSNKVETQFPTVTKGKTVSYRVCLAFLPLQKPWYLWRV